MNGTRFSMIQEKMHMRPDFTNNKPRNIEQWLEAMGYNQVNFSKTHYRNESKRQSVKKTNIYPHYNNVYKLYNDDGVD
jgi:hypothetical protein